MTAKDLIFILKEKKYHITTAESCTGGLLASEIVSVSGASDVFEEGYITYSDRVKQKLLKVSRDTLDTYTAVSAQTAEEMARGAAGAAGTEVSVSVTGYAGPDAGADGTPAGTVYIGVWIQGEVTVEKYQFSGERNEVRRQAVQAAIELLFKRIGE